MNVFSNNENIVRNITGLTKKKSMKNLNKNIIGIYKITNPKGKIYIGQSIDIERRFKEYKTLQCKNQPKIYNSLYKYTPENHMFEIIEECIFEQLNNRELYWKLYYNSINEGLNCELYDNGIGPRSEETKLKISSSQKGNKYNLGKKRTKETKQLQSDIAKSQIWRKNVGIKQKGKNKHSNQHIKQMCKKIIDNNTGIIYNSCTEASLSLGISMSLISNSLNKIYKKSKWNFNYYE
jgi:group I intron endonuclease